MPPAWIAMAIVLHTVACGLNRCDNPNNRAVSANARPVPMRPSTILNRMPRKISSSVTTAAAVKPNSATAPAADPQPATS
jgi:hypothetical protein